MGCRLHAEQLSNDRHAAPLEGQRGVMGRMRSSTSTAGARWWSTVVEDNGGARWWRTMVEHDGGGQWWSTMVERDSGA
ncbi:hypothetical protein EYF80_057339 [Liparis tanakae]|uniref:Uncharacterized protein n=1 Tax=Liparis tanakae TaxID=230148 RepID=A0A4Z2EV23_9TELE|nr:hypothetical protein EYF80_057339 [Liparis tanakae]